MLGETGWYAHQRAIVDTGAKIGPHTTIWANAHVMAGAVIGAHCNVAEGVFVEDGAKVGDRVTLKNGVQVWRGVVLEDDVFVGPNATFCNDRYPRSKQHLTEHPRTLVCKGASLGANCTILPGIRIGHSAMVGAGAVVTHDVPDNAVVVGNPARLLRYIESHPSHVQTPSAHTSLPSSASQSASAAMSSSSTPSAFSSEPLASVPSVKVLCFPEFRDRRGVLEFGEYGAHLPWIPRRFFVIRDVPENEIRGYHAHKSIHQLFVCLSGRISVHVDDGHNKQDVILAKPNVGLLLPPMTWSWQHYMVPGSILLVLASEVHQPEGYIHDHSTFLSMKHQQAREDALAAQRVPFLNLKEATSTLRNDLTDAFNRVLDSGCYVLGSEVEGFEKQWAEYCGVKHCVGVGSGLAALHLMLAAAGVKEGDEVIVPANTYIATMLAVSAIGAKPVLVEPNPLTYNLNPDLVEAAITSRTRAILSVDLYGQPADILALQRIANARGLLLFTDAAQSHGATVEGVRVGSFGDATAFSFYPSKNLGALGEAGAVTTNSDQLAEKVRLLRNYGSAVRYFNEMKGYNERLDPLQAAFLRCKIPKLDTWNEARRRTASFYLSRLTNLPWLILPQVPEWCTPSWHLFVVRCAKRDALQAHLAKRDIQTIVHYPIPPHLSEAYAEMGFGRGSFPIAEELADTVLSLPICPFLTDEQRENVVTAILSFHSA